MSDSRSFEIERSRRSESREHSFVGEDNEGSLTASPSFSNIHTSAINTDRYRSLVNESPPANFSARTPQDEKPMELKHNTPSPLQRENSKILSPVAGSLGKQRSRHSSPITREFRTPSEWDELMRSKGIILSNVDKDNSSIKSPTMKTTKTTPQNSSSVSEQPKRSYSDSRHKKKHMTATESAALLLEQPKSSGLPSYMRTTVSYESRLHRLHREAAQSSRQKQINKKPRFQSSTRINAMDDIHNEMRDEDVYIPLAVRIKLFEQNLRGGNPTSSGSTGLMHHQNQPIDTHHPTTSSTLTRPRSPKLLTRYRTHSSRRSLQSQSNQEQKRQPLSAEQANTNILTNHRCATSRYKHTRARAVATTRKGYNGNTLTSTNKNKHISTTTATHKPLASATTKSDVPSKPIKKQKLFHTTSVQPFRFATDERALHHQKQFKAKLDLWKEKDKKTQGEARCAIRDEPMQARRGTKRKVQEN